MAAKSQSVLDSLRRIVQAARQSSAQCERAAGLTSAQLLVLKSIAANPGLSINDLAALTLTHQASVSEVVRRMEGRGLLLRERSPEDARRLELQLTREGREALARQVETIQETLIKAMDRLPPDVLDHLADGLDLLIDEAGIAHGPAPMLFEDGDGHASEGGG
jgi:DNA-binding MarR family transcriptional regulator